MACSVCGKTPLIGFGYCKKHYRAFKKYGDPLRTGNARGVIFDDRYEVRGDCWVWIKGTSQDGYGLFVEKGEVKAHRVSWVRKNGPIPAGMHVLHKCDNPSCVNPKHLFLGTHTDNMADMRTKKRARTRPQLDDTTYAQLETMVPELNDFGFYEYEGREIAKLLGISENAVYKRTVSRPEAPGVREIRRLYDYGYTQTMLATLFNTEQTVVGRYVRGIKRAQYSK